MITPEILEHAAQNLREDRNWLEGIEYFSHQSDRWEKVLSAKVFDLNYKVRIKPKMLQINGLEYPEPLKGIHEGERYWCVATNQTDGVMDYIWCNDEVDKATFSRRLVHSTKEAAQQHCAALLGIDVEELRE